MMNDANQVHPEISALRIARLRAGISQVKLAVAAGVSVGSVVRAEQGAMGRTVAKKLARALGVALDSIWKPRPLDDEGSP